MSWVAGAADSGYGADHLPYGATAAGLWARIGDRAIDLRRAEETGLVEAGGVLVASTLNPLLAAGPPRWATVRVRLAELVTDPAHRAAVEPLLSPVDDLDLVLPFAVADYVDFYSSEYHAANVGRILRPDDEPLLPNWKHLPVGYHGRAGTVVVSGTDIVRPCGQRSTQDGPAYGASSRLDVEAEVGFVVGVPTALGDRVSTVDFARHVFGVVLVNDWSARDIQAWEYRPLGPFLGKSFATSIAGWVTPIAALDGARVAAPVQEPAVLGYLTEAARHTYDLGLTVVWNGALVSRPPFASLYWTPAQQLAHLTVNGARLRTGDLFASGTVSGPERGQMGSFLELSWGGRDPVALDDGANRTFLADGDIVTISATAPGLAGGQIRLGAVSGRVLPAQM